MVQPNNDAMTSIAITGLACRMPGSGDNLNRFWDSICNGESAWSPIPRSRFHADAFPGNVAKGGHFLREDISLFDAKFFNVRRDEARAMDPQQRLMLEVVYEALEAAGYPLGDIAGTATGVYMGQFTDDYRELVSRDAETSLPYSMTGLQRASLSNRISWMFDLRGPSFTVATACSSSLVALHLACQSLQSGETDMAIVGGCNLMINPNMFIFQSGQGFLSPDGRCKTFDASADGYGRGEGFAAVVLRRVDDAVSLRDPIRAVIRGSGSNQDGHTKGFTLPSADAQASLIRDVYRRAGLDFSLTGYVEAHGTGTKAGDLEETTALSRTIAAGLLPTGRKLVVGSVKSNIGHLEAGAGLAAVVKSVLMLERGVIPPNINLHTRNPALRLDEWNLQVPMGTVMPWPTDGLRRISINSFGYGGSNAHVILDDTQSYLTERGLDGTHYTQRYAASRKANGTRGGVDGVNGINGVKDVDGVHGANGVNGHSALQTTITTLSPLLFTISAQDKGGIARVANALKTYLVDKKKSLGPSQQPFLRDLAFTLNTRRSHLQWKTFCVASSLDELISALEYSSSSSPSPAAPEKDPSPPPPPPRLSSRPPRIAFIFTGQGAQWPTMGTALLPAHAAFRDSIRAADRYLGEHLGCAWSAADELARPKSSSRIHTAELAQPLCTILQVALVDLLRSWGVRPSAVAGHSSGEMAAAYCVGALTREQAWKVAYFRGVAAARRKAQSHGQKDGAMMAVGAAPEEVAALIRASGLAKGVCVACENAPASVTVSGDADAVDKLAAVLQEKGVFARRLFVDVAYHSPHMHSVAREYLEAIADVAPKGKSMDGIMYSSVTGQKVGDPSELGAAYWIRNLISPVRFSTAVRHLVAADVIVEVGPHTALQGPTTQSLRAVGVADAIEYHSVIRRDRAGLGQQQETALELAGNLFARGNPVDLAAVNNNNNQGNQSPRTRIDLPAYPWDHSRSHWAESRLAREYRLREPLPRSLLLGPAAPAMVASERVWRGHISPTKEGAWLADHKIHGTVLLPAAGFIAMAAEAALALNNADSGREVSKFRLRDIHLTKPLILGEDFAAAAAIECSVCLRPHQLSANKAASSSSSEWMEFSISSSPDGKVLERNCVGLITLDYRSDHGGGGKEGTKVADSHQQAWKRRFQEASELCKNPVQVDQFYQRMASAGLQYGPAFKNLTEVRAVPGKSVGSVRVPDIGQSRQALIVHPATLDAVIHMAFAAVAPGPRDALRAMVPKSIDEVVISTDFPTEPKATISGYSTVSRHGYTETLADMTMQEDILDQPVLKITGLCCAEVAGAPVSDDNNNAATIAARRGICSKMVWRPAVGLLRSEEELKKSIRQAVAANPATTTTTTTTTAKNLSEVIKLVHHSKPEISIVELFRPSSIDTTEQPLLSTLDITGALKTASYTIYVRDDPTRQAVEAHLQALLSDVGVEMHDSGEEEGSRTFDLVIVDAHSTTLNRPLEEAVAAIENATKLLASDGRLVVVTPTEQADSIAEACGQAVDWLRLDDGPEQRRTLLVGQRRQETGPVLNGTVGGDFVEVVVLQSSNPSTTSTALAASLAAQLTSTTNYSSVSLRTWGACDTAAFSGKACISLVDIDGPVLQHATEDDFNFFKGLILGAQKVLWVGASSETAPGSAIVTGLARVVRSEEPDITFHTLNLNLPSEMDSDYLSLGSLIFRAFQKPGGENEFRVNDGIIEVGRVVQDDELNAELLENLGLGGDDTNTNAMEQVALGEAGGPVKLCVRNPGLLDSLCFEPDEVPDTALADDEVEIDVKATSLNFRDVMTAMGQLPSTELGFDAAGIVRRSSVARFCPGDRVAICKPGAHRTVLRSKADLVEAIPPGMTFAQAATIPLVHGTAWYALVRLARVRKAQSILVHVAAGGVGQAALQIAQHVGMEIFATVGSEPKRRLLREAYGIPDDHIFSSRDLAFARGIKRMTGGRGVDVVLNSLSGEALRQTWWYCVAPFGTFVEIGVRDILDNARLDMRPFLHERTFTFFDLKRIMQQEKPELMGEIMRGVFDLQRRHITRPVDPIAVFGAAEVESAFRLMQAGQHMGKIVISFEDDAQMVPLWRSPSTDRGTRPSVVQPVLDPDAVYLLAGGLGGLGRSLSRMLVDHGARKLCFLTRSAGASERPAVCDLIRDLRDGGAAQVLVLRCDVADKAAVRQAVSQCTGQLGGRVAGVIQCAMVLRDALFRNMTHADWAESTRPKIDGTWNLHAALPDVDFFVSLASFTAIFGSRGVANYAAGSTYQDAVAHFRRAEGKHAVTLDLSIVRDAGVLAETGMTQALKDLAGPYGLDQHEVAELVWLAISGDVAGRVPPQIVTGIATGGSAVAGGSEAPWYLDDPKFAIMRRSGLKGNAAAAVATTQAVDDVQAQLSRAETMDQAASVITKCLVDRVAKMLQTTTAEIDTERYLYSYGIDSLVAIEMVNWALKVCAARVTVFDIMAAVPITTMARKIAANSTATRKEVLEV